MARGAQRLIVILCCAPFVVAAETIDLTQLSSGAYRATLESKDALSVADSQRAVWATAVDACSGRSPRYGRYQFESKREVPKSGPARVVDFKFEQDFDCAGDVDEPVRGEARMLSADEHAQIEAHTRELTDRYLTSVAGGDYASAFAALADAMQRMTPLDEWQRGKVGFGRVAGSRVSGRVADIVIIVDPPSVAEPGVYASVDYELAYEHVPFQCGHMVWHQRDASAFRIVREESGYLDESLASQLSTSQISEIRRQYGCAFSR